MCPKEVVCKAAVTSVSTLASDLASADKLVRDSLLENTEMKGSPGSFDSAPLSFLGSTRTQKNPDESTFGKAGLDSLPYSEIRQS